MTCDHGYEHPHCPKVGCENSRPAVRLEDWIRAEGTTREPSMDLPAPRAPVAPLSEEERRERDRAGRELQRNLDELARRDNASGDMTRGRGFIGVQEDGRKARGAPPWWWQGPLVRVSGAKSSLCCCGDPKPHMCRRAQPTHVPGAPPDDSRYVQRTIRDIGEAQAERENLRRDYEAGAVALDLPPAKAARERMRRHRRAG